MSIAVRLTPRPSSAFADDEPVFGNGYVLLPGIPVPIFGETRTWGFGCIRRPSNIPVGAWRINFLEDDPTWNLRYREVAFAQMNPTHRAIRDAGIALTAEPAALRTITNCTHRLGQLGTWAADNEMTADLSMWDEDDWADFLKDMEEDGVAISHLIAALRKMSLVAPVLNDGAPDPELWTTKSIKDLIKRSRTHRRTNSIPPAVWWPLLRAAWTYIHVFSRDVFDLRDRMAAEQAEHAKRHQRPPREQTRQGAEITEMVERWLADPGNLVPVHANDFRTAKAGEPIWHTLSQMISQGTNSGFFHLRAGKPSTSGRLRRRIVMEAVERAQVQAIVHAAGLGAGGAINIVKKPARYIGRPSAELDQELRDWIADPNNAIPIRAKAGQLDYQPEGSVIWGIVERMVYGPDSRDLFSGMSKTGLRRRGMVEEVAATGRVQKVGGSLNHTSLMLDCDGLAEVTLPDGTFRPWRTQFSLEELEHELRMVRAACYVFTAALTMMRDSEIQEIEREALTTYYGAPAVTSRKIKKDPAQPQLNWWISEPIVETLAVLERLSWHETHLLVGLTRPEDEQDRSKDTRRGIMAAAEIDYFIKGANDARTRTGLEEIPPGKVRPHMFRKTMAIICSQEPDSEIALGIQLKHIARRALANKVTQSYSQMDANWAKEFDTQLELAAARRLVDLLKARRSGEGVAVGPGAVKLHAGLDRVIEKVDSDPKLRAQLADEQIETMLLREEFPNLYFGTLNHCIHEAEYAECEKALPKEQRTGKPILGACQPARCRNSAVSKERHGPIWLAEDADLLQKLKDQKLSKPRREALQNRHAEVRLITGPWLEQENA